MTVLGMGCMGRVYRSMEEAKEGCRRSWSGLEWITCCEVSGGLEWKIVCDKFEQNGKHQE